MTSNAPGLSAAPIPAQLKTRLAGICRAYHIERLSLFGSVLRADFGPQSDVDILVDFEPGHTPDFITLYEIERELSLVFGGRSIDLVTSAALNRHLRDVILTSAEVVYDQE